MLYPDAQTVEVADKYMLARWIRFLPSPGWNYVGADDFTEKIDLEVNIMKRIMDRFGEMGGWTPEISKECGIT